VRGIQTFIEYLGTTSVDLGGQSCGRKMERKSYQAREQELDRKDFSLAKRKEMGCKVDENIPSLVGFQPKVLLISIGRPTAPEFDFKFGRRVRKGSQSRGNPGSKTVAC
jgi:hypothetical protein